MKSAYFVLCLIVALVATPALAENKGHVYSYWAANGLHTVIVGADGYTRDIGMAGSGVVGFYNMNGDHYYVYQDGTHWRITPTASEPTNYRFAGATPGRTQVAHAAAWTR